MRLVKSLYYRLFYRRHMMALHARGKHRMRHYGPMFPNGGEFDKCDWCGHIENVVPAPTPFLDHLRARRVGSPPDPCL